MIILFSKYLYQISTYTRFKFINTVCFIDNYQKNIFLIIKKRKLRDDINNWTLNYSLREA